MIANTLQVRKIVRDTIGVTLSWTDRSADPTMRNMGGYASLSQVQQVREAFQAQGFTNRVYSTPGYIRIRASFPGDNF